MQGSKQSITGTSCRAVMEIKGNEVSGKARYRFFYKSCSNFLGLPNLKFAPPACTTEEKSNEPTSKTKGCQTDYRDSEAQTDPYSPSYIGPDDSEVLTLRNLVYKFGQTIQNSEVEILERRRERKMKEAQLPPITDERTLRIHQNFLHEQKQKDYEARENELDAIMQERLQAFESEIMARNKSFESLAEKRICKLRIRQQKGNAMKQSFHRSKDIQLIRTQLNNIYINEYRSPKSVYQHISGNRSIQYQDQDRKSVALANDLKLIDSIVRSNSSAREDAEFEKPTQFDQQESFLKTKEKKDCNQPPTPISEQCLEPVSTREGATILLQRIIRGTYAQKKLCQDMTGGVTIDNIVSGIM